MSDDAARARLAAEILAATRARPRRPLDMGGARDRWEGGKSEAAAEERGESGDGLTTRPAKSATVPPCSRPRPRRSPAAVPDEGRLGLTTRARRAPHATERTPSDDPGAFSCAQEIDHGSALFARGLALGFTIAAAVGPISLLTIRRTLAHGRIYGLASGMGVALADATYGGIAAFGLTAVTAVLVGGRVVLGLVGGVFLLVLAWRTMTSRPSGRGGRRRPGLVGAFLSIFGLTMTNPMTILSFAAIFAGLGVVGRGGADAALLTLGVFCGSASWWVILTGVVSAFRARVTVRWLTWVNRASGRRPARLRDLVDRGAVFFDGRAG